MFVQATKNKTMRERDIIGIFDLDSSTVSQITRNFLNNAEKQGKTVGLNTLPKSFVLTDSKIYLSPHLPKYIGGR